MLDLFPSVDPPREPSTEPVDSTSLRRRIEALLYAVEDIEGHALRLARWRARKAAARAAGVDVGRVHPRCYSPMRPGRPPGWKQKPRSEVDHALKDLHMFAREVWEWPDTS